MVPSLQVSTWQQQSNKNSRKIRANKAVTKSAERGAFFTGGNSSCRAHIRQHYELYRDRCKEAGIQENHFAIPRPLWRQMEEKRLAGKGQAKIDEMLEIQQKLKPKQFTCDGAVEAIAQFIVCDDQVRQYNVKVIVLGR